MSKARTLADFISDGSEFADGTISVAEVSGAAPLASPSFTGNLTTGGNITLDEASASAHGEATKSLTASGNGYYQDLLISANDYDFRYGPSAWNSAYSALQISSTGSVVFNEGGVDADFRVESSNNTHALFVDAGSSEVGINNNTPDAALHVKTTGNNVALFESSHATSTQFFIRNSNAVTGTYATLGFAPANNISGAYIQSTAQEDFSAVVNRTANMVFYTRDNGTFHNRLYLDDDSTVFNEVGRATDFRVESDANSNMLHINAGDSHVNIGSSTAHGVLGVQQGASAGVNATTLGLNHVHANNKYIDFKWYNGSLMNIAQEGGSNIGINWSNTLAFNSTESGSSDFRIASDTISHLFAIDASENRVSIGGTSFSEGSGYRFNVKGGTSRFINSAADVQMRVEGGGYTDPHRARLTLTGGYGDTGRTRFWHIDGQAHGGGGNVYNDLRFGYEVSNSATLYEVMRFNNDGHVIVNENGASNVDFRVESDTNTHAFYIDAGNGAKYFGTGTNQGTTGAGTFNIVVDGGDAINLTHNVNGNHVFNISQIGTTTSNFFYFSKNGSARGNISVSTSGTTYNSISDYRLKENVSDLIGATARLKQLSPKRFNFIDDPNSTIVDGFIAHEAQTVVPEAVTGTHNEVDADGNPVYQGIDQAKLVPLLVATIKELEARITALENP